MRQLYNGTVFHRKNISEDQERKHNEIPIQYQ